MREIKFRAWDKSSKMMADWNALLALCDGQRIAGVPPGLLEQFERNAPNNSLLSTVYEGNPFKMENFILLQFTGIQDRNGVDVYEGDILKDSDGSLGVVEYTFTEFLAMDNSEHCWNILDNTSEVIGNIYENPELLK